MLEFIGFPANPKHEVAKLVSLEQGWRLLLDSLKHQPQALRKGQSQGSFLLDPMGKNENIVPGMKPIPFKTNRGKPKHTFRKWKYPFLGRTGRF